MRFKFFASVILAAVAGLWASTTLWGQEGAPAAGQGETPGQQATTIYGIDKTDMDATANACKDFSEYANGGWLKKNPIPPSYPSWGTFDQLIVENRQKLRGILDEAVKDKEAAPGSNEQKLRDFYSSCMDEAGIEAQGAKPLVPEFGRIAAIHNVEELEAEISHLQSLGVGALFSFRSHQDLKNSNEVVGVAHQGGLGLPERDYYVKSDAKSKKIRQEYLAHVAKMFELLGDSAGKAEARAGQVMALETKLAKASKAPADLRDPEKNYHPMTIAELKKLTPDFSWPRYLRSVGAPELSSVDIGQPEFFRVAGTLLKSTSLSSWKAYLRWHLIDAEARYLSSSFVTEDFNFYDKTLRGTKEILPRWQRCVANTDRQLGFALGKQYVAKYFPPEAKKRADEMVHNLIQALNDDIETLDWMGPATKKAAEEKLAAFGTKIGYPDTWRDYSKYDVVSGPYVINMERGAEFEHQRDLNKIGKPVDRTEWGMTPPTVNAYNSSSMNEIVFPAGILQPPFFDPKADDAVNYGGIGAVIGHEMTHGFDDEGRKFDAHGNLRDWWTVEDAKNYEARANCVEKQFDGYVVSGKVHENGKLVLGESIADLGGLTIAYKAYQASLHGQPAPVIDGLTGDQRFFLSWAHVWASNERPEYELLLTHVDPHPLDHFRAIAAPSNLPAFAKAFGCRQGDPMVRQEECRVW